MDATPHLSPARPCQRNRRGGGPGCGQPVIPVQSTAGAPIMLDGRGEADGNVWLVEDDTGQWRAQKHPPTKDGVASIRCRQHRCRTGSDPLVGPCAGGCGGTIRRYDPPAPQQPTAARRRGGSGAASTLCRWCQDILDKWRAEPQRPTAIPFGRWTNGVYQPVARKPRNN